MEEEEEQRSTVQSQKLSEGHNETLKHRSSIQRIFWPPLSGSLIFSSVQQDIFRCSDRIVHLLELYLCRWGKSCTNPDNLLALFCPYVLFSYILIIKSHQSIALLSACLRASILLSPCRVIALWQGMMGTEEPFICRLAFISQSHRTGLSLYHQLARPVWCPSRNFARQHLFCSFWTLYPGVYRGVCLGRGWNSRRILEWYQHNFWDFCRCFFFTLHCKFVCH